MNTIFLLLAQYDAKTVIPAELVVRDFFPHLSVMKFLRKVSEGSIVLPIVRIEHSQKAAKGVHIQDLADYIEKRRAAAHKELEQLTRP